MSATLRLFFSIFEEDLHYFQELFKLLFKFDMSIILVKKVGQTGFLCPEIKVAKALRTLHYGHNKIVILLL